MLLWKRLVFILLSMTSLSACTKQVEQAPVTPAYDLTETHVQFFHALRQLCGLAFEGQRIVAREDRRELLQGDETLIAHFRDCTEQTIWVPFHIGYPEQDEWDRSRTWIYTLYEKHLALSHDHRLETGESRKNTGYGGLTVSAGDAHRQLFIFSERTGDKGEVLGWRIEIIPGERYSYGTMADGSWTWRVDFDLTKPVPAPPAPWGYY